MPESDELIVLVVTVVIIVVVVVSVMTLLVSDSLTVSAAEALAWPKICVSSTGGLALGWMIGWLL